MISYDNLIIQRQTHNWQSFSIFLFDHAIQLPKWALFCQPYAVCAGMEPRQDFLPCGPARIPYVAEKESKLELASAMVRQVMPEFSAQKNVIIMCGSWYVCRAKGTERESRRLAERAF